MPSVALQRDRLRRAHNRMVRLARRLLAGSSNEKPKVLLPDRLDTTPCKYLSVVAIFKNEARYLSEWMEFHRLMGVEHFYLYDHGSTDEPYSVLDPYVSQGIATVVSWPFPYRVDRIKAQILAYVHALLTAGDKWRWMAFIDVDEFLFPMSDANLPATLARYEDMPSLAVFWALFGHSGHDTAPDGLVTENYTMRAKLPGKPKSIVDPSKVRAIGNAHLFDFDVGQEAGFDENRRIVTKQRFKDNQRSDVLRLNHYITRSREEFKEKYAERVKNRSHDASRLLELVRQFEGNLERDEEILKFVPALKQRLCMDT